MIRECVNARSIRSTRGSYPEIAGQFLHEYEFGPINPIGPRKSQCPGQIQCDPYLYPLRSVISAVDATTRKGEEPRTRQPEKHQRKMQ
jgi:hypothetical protein